MSSRRYTTEFVIKGDSSSGVKASRDLQRANADLTQEMQRAERQSQQMDQSFESVSMHAQRLATVTGAATAAVSAMSVSQTRNIAEQAALARSVGVTVQTLQQWDFAAQSVNLGAGKMGDIFKDAADKIGDFVATGGGEAADLFERLNLNINELMVMSPDQQLLAIGEALDGVATRGEKIFFMEALANDASRLIPLLENNAALLREQAALAERLGISMDQSDIDSIEEANQALNELNALATGFANTVAVNLAPSFVSLSSNAQSVVEYMGGMGDVVDDVSDGTLMLATVLAGRLVGSMASAAAASISKVQADRAVAVQAGITAEAEAAAALATTRRTAAEKQTAMALLSTAQLEAQATKGTVAHTFALQQLSVARTRAATAAGAHTAAMAASTSAARAATAAQAGLATATNAARGALALVGGPLGAAVLAGAGIYAFREELGLTLPQIDANTTAVDKLTAGLDDMSQAAAQLTLTSLVAQLAEVRAQAEATGESFLKVGQIEGDNGGFLGADVTAQTTAVREIGEASNEAQQETANLEAAIALVEGRLGKLGERNREIIPTITAVGDAEKEAAKAAAKAAEEQAKALQTLQQEIDPLLADHQTYIERLGVLDKALSDGTISEEAHAEAVRWSAEQYTRAATGAEDYEKQTESLVNTYDSHNQKARQLQQALEQINERYRAGEIDGDQYTRMVAGVRDEMQQLALEADPAAQELARAWEEASNRIDETFADAFAGAFESFDDFGSQLLDGFKRLLAELAYQATLKPIVVAFTGDMQSMMSGGGGGLGGTLSAARGVMKGSSLFGGGSSAVTAGGLYSGASTGAAAGGLYGNAVTGGLAKTGIMSSISSGVSAAMPWIGAGLLADNVLGLGIAEGITKAIGSLFGSDRKSYGQIGSQIGGDVNSGDGVYRYDRNDRSMGWAQDSALGTIGVTKKQKTDDAALIEMVGAFVEIDNTLASVMTAAQLEQTRSALNGWESSRTKDIGGIVDERLSAVLNATNSAFADILGGFDGERLVQGLVGGLQVENVGSEMAAAVAADMNAEFRAALASGSDIDAATQSILTSAQAVQVLGTGADRLNIQFNDAAHGALAAAGNIAEMVGGVDALAQAQQGYYESFYTEGERATRLQAELGESLAAMNLQLPDTRMGYRQLVEAQNLNTAAGQHTYAMLLELAPAFAELVPEMGELANGARDFAAELSAARDVMATAEDAARKAWQTFDGQAFDQQRQLLGLMGDSEAALALERERELAAIDEALRPTQQRIWALQDEATAVNDYATALESASGWLETTLDNIAGWVDARRATSGTPGANFAQSGDQFERQLELARAGDREALQSITEYADRYLSSAGEYYASGDGFQSVEADVLAALEALPDQLSPEDYIAQSIKDALEESGNLSSLPEMKDLAGEQLGALNSLIDEMERSAGQFISIDANIVSVRESINALGVAQDEIARIEREKAAAEAAERERLARVRAAELEKDAIRVDYQNRIAEQQGIVSAVAPTASQGLKDGVSGWQQNADGNWRNWKGWESQFDDFTSMIKQASATHTSDAEFNNWISQYKANDPNQEWGYNYIDGIAARIRAREKQERANATIAALQAEMQQAIANATPFANGAAFTNSIVSSPTLFDMGLMGEAGDEAIMPLSRGAGGRLGVDASGWIKLPDAPLELPIPDMPLPHFPQLGNADVLQALKDLSNENKQLRADINRLLGDVKTNTGNTANAVASSAGRAEQQRTAQLEEQRAATRAARLKGSTV